MMNLPASQPLNTIEKGILFSTALIVLTGIALYFIDEPSFLWYVQEDQLVEWLTVAGLLAGSIVCFTRVWRLRRSRKPWFLFVTFMLGLLLFLAAGEEISWGQRLLGIESSEYFQKNNAQGETNFHNLVVDGVKLNKLIFSTLLSIMLGIYLVLIPVLYHRNKGVRQFMDRSGVPIARLYQIIGFIMLIVITSIFRHHKSPELLECGAALLFFLIIRYPQNVNLFSDRNHNTSTL